MLLYARAREAEVADELAALEALGLVEQSAESRYAIKHVRTAQFEARRCRRRNSGIDPRGPGHEGLEGVRRQCTLCPIVRRAWGP